MPIPALLAIGIALDEIVKLGGWVHGTIGMFMFIAEEACQSLGMACYIAQRAEDLPRAKELAQYGITNLCDPMIEFCHVWGKYAYPLHYAYEDFFLASKLNFETYLGLE